MVLFSREHHPQNQLQRFTVCLYDLRYSAPGRQLEVCLIYLSLWCQWHLCQLNLPSLFQRITGHLSQLPEQVATHMLYDPMLQIPALD